jgi:arsenite methyltransferase
MLGLGTAYVVGRGAIPIDETRSSAADLESLGDDYFFSLNRYLFSATRSRARF